MDPQLSIVTLGVHDLTAARRFYVEGLGWTPTVDIPGEIVAIQVGHGLLLSLYDREDLADEAGDIYSGPHGAPISLGHVVADEGAVTKVLDQVAAAGGTVLAPAQRRSLGWSVRILRRPRRLSLGGLAQLRPQGRRRRARH